MVDLPLQMLQICRTALLSFLMLAVAPAAAQAADAWTNGATLNFVHHGAKTVVQRFRVN